MTALRKADETADRLAILRPAYLHRLEERQAAVARAAQTAMNPGFNEEEYRDIHRTVHSMASSAAIYGYQDLSDAARAAERVFDDAASTPDAKQACLSWVAGQARVVLDSVRTAG